jgi:competence ComEA-like helix-hairpin-helix protein
LQTLHEQLLARVKQNLPPAKSQGSLIVLVLLVLAPALLSVSGCSTRLRSSIRIAANLPPAAAAAPININTATAAQLESLPGVGKVIAERIIAHREQYGSFRRPEHLMMVRGISDRKFRELRTMIVVE